MVPGTPYTIHRLTYEVGLSTGKHTIQQRLHHVSSTLLCYISGYRQISISERSSGWAINYHVSGMGTLQLCETIATPYETSTSTTRSSEWVDSNSVKLLKQLEGVSIFKISHCSSGYPFPRYATCETSTTTNPCWAPRPDCICVVFKTSPQAKCKKDIIHFTFFHNFNLFGFYH